ncbi:MAG TPA: YceI family protein [Acidimicrobiales bacterium]|nr:YceI family protein [Acidimicrobiales bacterium]
MIKKILAAVVVLVVLAVIGAGAWYFLRDDTPEDLTVDDGSEQPAGQAPDSLDGTWNAVEGERTRALMAITEDFTALPDHTATGETPGVEGSITIAGSQVTEAAFTVDLTRLAFDDAPTGLDVANRRQAMDRQGLEIEQFPEASFTLTEPIDIGDDPAGGEKVTAEATGDLTLHGVTREITFTVEARVVGSQIQVAAVDSIPVALADHDIEKPTAPFLADVDDQGTFDFVIALEQG